VAPVPLTTQALAVHTQALHGPDTWQDSAAAAAVALAGDGGTAAAAGGAPAPAAQASPQSRSRSFARVGSVRPLSADTARAVGGSRRRCGPLPLPSFAAGLGPGVPAGDLAPLSSPGEALPGGAPPHRGSGGLPLSTGGADPAADFLDFVLPDPAGGIRIRGRGSELGGGRLGSYTGLAGGLSGGGVGSVRTSDNGDGVRITASRRGSEAGSRAMRRRSLLSDASGLLAGSFLAAAAGAPYSSVTQGGPSRGPNQVRAADLPEPPTSMGRSQCLARSLA
jgi:hypothetical protein